jgi:hypothetical protein
VTPLVLFLASRRCRFGGEIFAVGAGYFARIAIVEGSGVRFEPNADITPEALEERMDAIRDVGHPRIFRSVLEAVDNLAGS